MKIANVTFQEYNVNILSKLALSTLSFLLKKEIKKHVRQKLKIMYVIMNLSKLKIVVKKTCRHIFCTSALLSTMYVYVAIHVCCV